MIDLKNLRIQADLSQQDLAEILGIGRSYVSKLERGHRQPDLHIVIEWARACGFELELMVPADAMVVASLRSLGVRDRRVFSALIAAWPDLPDTRREDLRTLVRMWLDM